MKVHEEFLGISGEVCYFHQGCLTYFVRLAGCNLSCEWCDTKRSQKDQDSDYIALCGEILERVLSSGARHVLITGGEPLVQFYSTHNLIRQLYFRGIHVSIETNGSIFWEFNYDNENVSFVVDYKMESSGMKKQMLPFHQYLFLNKQDFLKMVVATEEDFEEAITLLKTEWSCRVFRPVISPMVVDGIPMIPAQYIIDRLWKEKITDAILSIQMHKMLNVR